MLPSADAGALAEAAASAATLADYEREAVRIMGRVVGFDVAMFKRAGGPGPYTPGLDPAIRRACRPHWQRFAEEIVPVAQVALRQRGVAVDLDVLGVRGLERLSYYQHLMRPHGGSRRRSSASRAAAPSSAHWRWAARRGASATPSSRIWAHSSRPFRSARPARSPRLRSR